MAKRNLKVASMVLSMFGTNVYFVFDEDATFPDNKKHGILIDPADRGERIYKTLEEKGFVIDLILLTHGHCDHIGGCEELKKFCDAKIGCYEKEWALCNDYYLNCSEYFDLMKAKIQPDISYRDGEVIEAAGLSCKLIPTPGHTSGSCSYYFEDGGMVFCGDTLFMMSVGRTDLPTSSTSELLRSINDKLFTLPDDTIVYPGHGEPTTIEFEKMNNYNCRIM